SETTKESKNRVVAVGTKVKPTNNEKPSPADDSSGSNGSQSDNDSKDDSEDVSANADDSANRKFQATVTAYSANCNGCTGKTATGYDLTAHPDAKVVAVDPNVIPLGSRVWVEGYGEAVARDTGGDINGKRIDI